MASNGRRDDSILYHLSQTEKRLTDKIDNMKRELREESSQAHEEIGKRIGHLETSTHALQGNMKEVLRQLDVKEKRLDKLEE